MGRIKDPCVVEPLKALLNDEYYIVRRDTAKALGEIGNKLALESLKQLINNDRSLDVRQAAKEAIEKIQKGSTE